jgi:hypothetical protein
VRDIYVTESSGGGITFYIVMVDGKVYDTMHLLKGPRLTLMQMEDIAQGYREGLDRD